MKRTIRLNESDLRGMIRDVILETFENRMENTPDPKYEVGDTVAVEYAADRMFGPDGQPAKIGAREWNGKDGVWMYFCMHPRLPRRGWWSEDQLQPFQHESLMEMRVKDFIYYLGGGEYDDRLINQGTDWVARKFPNDKRALSFAKQRLQQLERRMERGREKNPGHWTNFFN